MSWIRQEILNLEGYQLRAYPDLIKLNQNELPYDLPAPIKAKILERFAKLSWNRYPLPTPEYLKLKLSNLFQWPAEGILVSNGSNVLIQALLMATAIQSKVVVLNPSFSLYTSEARLLGNQVLEIPLQPNFEFPKQKLLSTLEAFAPRLVFIANPNAPTGNLFPQNEILEVVQKAQCLVVVDEAYFQFADENLLAQLSQFQNLILLRTFSKGFGLGGIRLGFALGNPQVIQQLSKTLLPFCVSGLSEIVADTLLDHLDLVQKRLDEIKLEREKLYQALTQFKQLKVFQSQTNFLIFQTPDCKTLFDKLVSEKILIRNVSYPPYLSDTLRVTVGSPTENEAFVNAVYKAFLHS